MARHKEFEPVGVIDRAIDVFLSKGYESTSVKDLVDATGLHPGSLYNFFGSKKQMFEAALERFYDISPFNRVLLDDKTPPRETMERLFAGIVNPCARPKSKEKTYDKCLITNAAAELGDSDPEITVRLQKYFELMEDRLCRVIERGQKSGDFVTEKSARDHARFMLSVVQGMSLLARLGENRDRLKTVATMALASLVKGRRKRRARVTSRPTSTTHNARSRKRIMAQ